MQTTYRVTIQGATAPAPGNGFIDNRKIEDYMAAGSTPVTYAQAEAKERANMRYETLIAKIQQFANIYVSDIAAPNANAITEATTFSFTATVEHGASSLVTQDEINPGDTISGVAALRRAVARALVVSKTDFGEVYDPTVSTAPGNPAAVPRRGPRISRIEFGALANNLTSAEALVTVTSIE